MFAVPLAGELHASVTSRGFPPSPRRRRQRCQALCDLQQLHPDTCVPGDCMYSHSRKTHTNKRRHTDDVKTILCIFTTGVSPGGGAAAHAALRLARRSQQLQQVGGQRLVRPTPSQLPGVPQQDSDRLQRDTQRLLHGLPEAVRMLHTTLCALFVRNFIFLSLNNSGFILFFSVSVLGEYNFTTADFTREDFFDTIRSYLTSGQSSD